MPAQNSKSIALTPQWDEWINALVESGEYKSASEVVRDGLRSLRDRREQTALARAEVEARLKLALDQAEAGQFAEGSGREAVLRAFEIAGIKSGK